MKVKECMCNNVCVVTKNTKICEVAKMMSINHIGSIPVSDENNAICGIVTDRDIILRTVACDKDIGQTLVSDIMTKNVCTCTQDDDIADAQCKMAKYQIRRLPVCDCNNKIMGILSVGDLTKNTTVIGKEDVCETIEKICDCNNKKNAE